MVIEVAQFPIQPGSEDAFAAAYESAKHLLLETEGCRSVRMTRGIESPSLYLLLVEWDSVEAHELNFRGGPGLAPWRAAIGPYFAADPHVEHFADV